MEFNRIYTDEVLVDKKNASVLWDQKVKGQGHI